jgi:hypothetical protein
MHDIKRFQLGALEPQLLVKYDFRATDVLTTFPTMKRFLPQFEYPNAMVT